MKILRVMTIGVTVGGLALAAMNTEKAEAAEWTPRTVEQIKADIAKTNGKEYTIVWGDTLSGISQATNITVQKLADMNQIANVDLIYAGNKLVFEGNVVSVKNGEGNIVAQTVIQPEDKVDPKKSVGQPVQGKESTSGNQADSIPGENKEGSAETPSQPANNANQNDVAGGSSNQGQTTPNTPANNSGETPSTSSNNGGASSQQSNTGNQGGSTTSSQTMTTESEKDLTPINLGNSGREFDTKEEARAYAYAQTHDETSQYNGWGYEIYDLFAKDNVPLGTFTVNFYQ